MWSNPTGQDTIANTLSLAIILIHQHPEVLDRCVCVVCVCVCVCVFAGMHATGANYNSTRIVSCHNIMLHHSLHFMTDISMEWALQLWLHANSNPDANIFIFEVIIECWQHCSVHRQRWNQKCINYSFSWINAYKHGFLKNKFIFLLPENYVWK